MTPGTSGEWTLTEASALLDEPQHRLIYLCEKGVVHPDIQDAEGRGSSRRFSARNLLEFAVALRLRDLEMAVSLASAVVYVLRAFERSLHREIPGFRLPESLREKGAPDLRVIIADGRRLYFSLGQGKTAPKVFGGIDLRERGLQQSGERVLERQASRSVEVQNLRSTVSFGQPEGSRHVRLEISVTGIARDLELGT